MSNSGSASQQQQHDTASEHGSPSKSNMVLTAEAKELMQEVAAEVSDIDAVLAQAESLALRQERRCNCW